MAKEMTGGCQCGAIRYKIEGSPREVVVCHCTECQRQSGSAFGMSLSVPPAAFTVVSGRLKAFKVVCDSKRVKTCSFCPSCGTRIHHRTENADLSIKAGTLDDTSVLNPTKHYWTKRKQPWVEIPAGATRIPDDG